MESDPIDSFIISYQRLIIWLLDLRMILNQLSFMRLMGVVRIRHRRFSRVRSLALKPD